MRVWTAKKLQHPKMDVWQITSPDETLVFMPDCAEDVSARVHFIVDACNAAEQRIRQTVTPLPEGGFNVHIEGIVGVDKE